MGGCGPSVIRTSAPGKPFTDPQIEPSTGFWTTLYKPDPNRLSLLGSSGWLGSTQASCLPLLLVSRINGAQPCDFCSSLVSSNIFVLNQPTTSPAPVPALVNHSVLLA